MSWRQTTTVAAALLVAVGGPRSDAQERPPFRSETTTVSVNASVKEGNRPVAGLRAADFRLSDAGVAQRIDEVAVESVPIDVTVLVDTSNSAGQEAERFRRNTRQIAAYLRDQDRLRVLAIDTYVRQILPMQAARAVPIPDRLPAGGMTSAYDALVAAMITPVGLNRRHLIVAMTDAWDTMSVIGAEDVLDVASRSDAVLHIALTHESSSDTQLFPARSMYHDRNLDALREATLRTGGDLHSAGAFAAADAVDVFRKVFDDFRVSYVLRYSPTGVERNGWHALKVSVARSAGYIVRARQGYFGG